MIFNRGLLGVVNGGGSYNYLESPVPNNGDKIATPSSVLNNISGDREYIIKVGNDHNSGPNKWGWSSGSISLLYKTDAFLFSIEETGTFQLRLRLYNHTDGGYAIGSTFSLSNGNLMWFRFVYTESTKTVEFFSAVDSGSIPVSWTSRGSGVFTNVLPSSSNELHILRGAAIRYGYGVFSRIYYAAYFDAVSGGTEIARFDPTIGSDPLYPNVSGEADWVNTGFIGGI